MKGIYLIVTAAGAGTRMGAGENKLFLDMGGKSILYNTLKAARQSGCFDQIIIAARPDESEKVRKIAVQAGVRCVLAEGGSERQYSVANALKLVPEDAEIVAVHDAARCLTTPGLFCKCVESAMVCGSGVAGKYAKDTVKRVENGEIIETLDRNEIVLIETPQVFSYKILKEAHEKAAADGYLATDEASLVERLGIKPKLIISKHANMKITTPADLNTGRKLMNADMRVGTGYDVHRCIEGRPLILGGVQIPCEFGLDGYSDADVLTHAIIDALLGAAGLSDIGHMFPDDNPEYKDIDSMVLLRDTKAALRGYSIVNIDATIIAQRPKLAEYEEKMKANIASVLAIPIKNINIKATTTEKLGFEGEGKGIAAQAVCLIYGQL